MLPEVSGTEVCRQIRAQPRTRAVAVIMLTAKSAEIDRVVGVRQGAPDNLGSWEPTITWSSRSACGS